MAAGLALSKANLVRPEGPTDGVSVLVRNGRALVRLGREVVADKADVASVVPTTRSNWTVTFADGTEWQVARVRVACCASRR